MATTQVALGFPTSTNLFQETALGNTAVTVKNASGTVRYYEIDNTANGGAASYVKVYNSNGAVTVGTTVPDDVLMVPAGATRRLVDPSGTTFGTGVQVACVTTGGTGGTTAPSSSVVLRVVYS